MSCGHLRDLGRGPDARDHVLALGVGQVLAVEDLLAGVGVAGERDAGPRVVAHVPEHHRHDVDRGPEVVGDVLAVAVVVGALAEPGGEDGLDREVELLVGVRGEVAAGVGLHDALELLDERLEVVDRQVGVGGAVAVELLARLERLVEPRAVHVHDDPAEHLDEPAIRVPAEPLVARERDQALQRLLVEAEVEDRVHHPGHRELGARADGDEQRVLRVAEALARPALDLAHRLEDVVPQARGQRLAGREVVVAGLGRDRESGRRRQARDRHLREARALAAEQVLHAAVAFGRPLAPRVDVALGGLVGSIGTGCGCRGHRDGCSSGSAPLTSGRGDASLQAAIVPASSLSLRLRIGAGKCRSAPTNRTSGPRRRLGRGVPSDRVRRPAPPGDPTQR